MPMDIALDNRQDPFVVQLTLIDSKANQTRRGNNLFVGRTYNEWVVPVATLLSYLAIQCFDHGPLFWTEEGQPLIQSKLDSLLRGVLSRVGIDPSGYSFQIGAAMTPAAVRIGTATIQTLGIWASDGYVRYTRMPWHSCRQVWRKKHGSPCAFSTDTQPLHTACSPSHCI